MGLTAAIWLGSVLTACGLGFAPAEGGTADHAPKVSRAQIRITPGDGAREVRPDDPFTVEAERGRLTSVRVADGEGTAIDGALSADRTRWQPRDRLALSAKYTVDAVAVDGDGRRAAKHAVFTTLVPRNTLVGYFTPEDGQTVGTGMIVSLDFNRPVADRAAVERAISVTSVPAVDVEPHWFGDQRLDFRPRYRWQPGTEVTLALRLRDVEAAHEVYGVQHKDVRFTVGRDQTSVVDAATHTMTVRRAGQVFRVLPVSAGAPDNPTYNGAMVVSEKLRLTRMNGDTVGFGGEYDIPDVPHALRLTRSGTFVHGSYWAPPGTFGSANTSHGCVGLYDVKGGGDATPAGWFFDHTLVGDTVTVVNSHDRTVAPDNGLGGWNLSWQQWLAGG
ncbi:MULTISPECIES: Ig-like domain-containing protein [unclassified Streptomyces]|uniref:L,D-transpeptidase n=1 Tax=unclassified Streptomyces TaxID=2593676 RepID=UPI0037F4F84C